jgi:hypothetical protein
MVSHELGIELEENAQLQEDKRLRLFALIVKGDIDAETETAATKQDWQEAQTLARELGDTKWSYRSLGQLGSRQYRNERRIEPMLFIKRIPANGILLYFVRH